MLRSIVNFLSALFPHTPRPVYSLMADWALGAENLPHEPPEQINVYLVSRRPLVNEDNLSSEENDAHHMVFVDFLGGSTVAKDGSIYGAAFHLTADLADGPNNKQVAFETRKKTPCLNSHCYKSKLVGSFTEAHFAALSSYIKSLEVAHIHRIDSKFLQVDDINERLMAIVTFIAALEIVGYSTLADLKKRGNTTT